MGYCLEEGLEINFSILSKSEQKGIGLNITAPRPTANEVL